MKCKKYSYKFIDTLQQTITVNELIFTKFKFAQLLIKNLHTRFQENWSKSLAAHTRSKLDSPPQKAFFFYFIRKA